jgi:hypothetical protein
LIERLSKDLTSDNSARSIEEALRLVDQLYGSMKGLDTETVKWIAEDEELCGY